MTDDSTRYELVNLFEVDSNMEIPAIKKPDGQFSTWTIMTRPNVDRCVPLRIRMGYEVGEAFHVMLIRCGVEEVIDPTERGRADFRHEGLLLPVVMVCGQDFQIDVQNRSESTRRFRCEVWGLPLVPVQNWRRVSTSRDEDVQGAVGAICCDGCQNRLALYRGSRVPLWCDHCVEIAAWERVP